MGVRLEEDVGKGCSYEDGSSANGVKKFDNNFSKKRTIGRNVHRQNHHVPPIHQQNQQVPNQRKPSLIQFQLPIQSCSLS